MSTVARDILVAVSLANLVFLAAWHRILSSITLENLYLTSFPLNWRLLAAPMLCVLTLAGILYGVILVVRRLDRSRLTRLAQLALVALLLIPLNVLRLRAGLLSHEIVGQPLLLSALIAAAVAVVIGLARWPARLASSARAVVLVLSPFVLVTFGQAGWMMLRYGVAESSERPLPADPGPGSHTVRVVWIVFDAMDKRLTFDYRPESVDLPELDRLKRESVYAVRARAPTMLTEQSIPVLLSGENLEVVEVRGPSEFVAHLRDTSLSVERGQFRSIFGHARGLGINTAVAGSYHPYCRLFGADLTACVQHPFAGWLDDASMGHALWLSISTVLGELPGVQRLAWSLGSDLPAADTPLFPPAERSWHRQAYVRLLSAGRRFAAEPELGLVFIHLPVPHLPPIYDRHEGRFKVTAGGSYLDNLVLADRALGRIRQAMQAAGTWANTAVLVTSDHARRSALVHSEDALAVDSRWSPADPDDNVVPFMLKMPEGAAVEYAGDLDLTYTHDLVLAVLLGKVTDSGDVVRFLESRRRW